MNILDQIVAHKKAEIESRRVLLPERELERRLEQAPPSRPFHAALSRASEMAVIAEIKKASPSAGVLKSDFDPVAIARSYAGHGANAVSVLTDEAFFQGRLSHLEAIRQAIPLPLLRKDFILERYQLLEARQSGADAVLLIAEILNDGNLKKLVGEARQLGLETLVELYEPDNLGRVLDSGTQMMGINNRNLRTFETRLEHTLEIAPRVPPDRLLVSESGIRHRDDLSRLKAVGVRAVLVGETFMRAADPGAKLTELLRGEPGA